MIHRCLRGFTLLEMMIVVAVGATQAPRAGPTNKG